MVRDLTYCVESTGLTGVQILVGYMGTFQEINSIIQLLSQPWMIAKEEDTEGAQGKPSVTGRDL